jgi:hypothetical protein
MDYIRKIVELLRGKDEIQLRQAFYMLLEFFKE